MMPGHEDREDSGPESTWKKTWPAAMMPGHEDREDLSGVEHGHGMGHAAMMPGHEDREDPVSPQVIIGEFVPQ